MKKIFVSMLLIGLVSAVHADGDKNRKASPILPTGENDCIYTVPEGIDVSNCTRIDSPDHSQVIYFCDGLGSITVICSD